MNDHYAAQNARAARSVRCGARLLMTIGVLAPILSSCDASRLPEVEAEPGEWTVSSRPLVYLGEQQRSDLSSWLGFRQVARRADGSVVIADEEDHTIRVIGSTGRKLFEFGGHGNRPGEFESLVWVAVLPGDSVLAYDLARTSFVKFTPDGRPVRSVKPKSNVGLEYARPVGLAPNGELFLLGHHPGVARTGFFTDSSLLYVVDRHQLEVTPIGSFPVYQRYNIQTKSGPYGTGVPHAPVGRFAVFGDGFLFGWGGEPVLHRYSNTGQLLATWRLPLESRVIDERVLRDARRAIRVANPKRRRDTAQAADEISLPVRYAYFDAILVTENRDIWVRPVIPDHQTSVAWLVLNSSGIPYARLRLPARFYPSNVRDSTVLGRYYDELGEQHLGLYRLVRPTAS